MKKFLVGVIFSLFFPMVVFAINANSPVYSGDRLNICTGSTYQSRNISINDSVYFGHCMEYSCSTKKTSYQNTNKVTCNNGNTNPYVNIVNSGCNNMSCSRGEVDRGTVKWCSIIMYYDCNRKSNGESFTTTTTTTTTKKTTRKITTNKVTLPTVTTKETTVTKVVDTKLASLEFSDGSIEFNSQLFEYTMEVPESVNNVDVKAVAFDSSNTVEITGNTNVVNGSVISIKVISDTGNSSEYKITIVKKEDNKLSSNSRLKYLSINGYDIDFHSTKLDYTVVIEPNVDKLDISFQTDDEKAVGIISGNENLKNGSKIGINVVAEDDTETYYVINIVVKKKSNLIKILFIIVLILSLLAGGYYIFKKIMSKKSGDKYEYE